MHISEQVAAELIAQGWDREGFNFRFSKMCETGGAFGISRITLIMDESGRWLESVDGWGNVIQEVDLRDYFNSPKEAIVAAIT